MNRVFALALPALMAILNLSSVAVLWFGGRLVSEGSMPIGNLTAFLTYIMQILISVMMAVMMAILLPRAVASAERIQQVLLTAPSISEPASPARPAHVTGMVQFDDVTFGYPGSERPVLQDISFTLVPGQTSAIIGGTGSGKTTLLNLIPRFFDATAGRVLVNGVDVRDQELEGLWSSIGPRPADVVPVQRHGREQPALRQARTPPTPSSGTRSRSPRRATSSRRCPAPSMPRSTRAAPTSRAASASGSSIARALVTQPRLYLFDDCFSALDAATDARLRAALKAETRDASVLIVAQRVSTIMHADQIIVLDEGRVAGIGHAPRAAGQLRALP